jgi:hypothetical protein
MELITVSYVGGWMSMSMRIIQSVECRSRGEGEQVNKGSAAVEGHEEGEGGQRGYEHKVSR